jgi:hypothetical protein
MASRRVRQHCKSNLSLSSLVWTHYECTLQSSTVGGHITGSVSGELPHPLVLKDLDFGFVEFVGFVNVCVHSARVLRHNFHTTAFPVTLWWLLIPRRKMGAVLVSRLGQVQEYGFTKLTINLRRETPYFRNMPELVRGPDDRYSLGLKT